MSFETLFCRRRKWWQAANDEGEEWDEAEEWWNRARPLASVARRQNTFFRKLLRRWQQFIRRGVALRHEQQIREREARAERDRLARLRRRHNALRHRLLPRGMAGAVYWRSEWRVIRAAYAAFRDAAIFAAVRRSWERWAFFGDE